MGFDGYEIMMDSNGHYELRDCGHWDEGDPNCEHCGDTMKPVGLVDQTNASPYPLEFELHQLTPLVRHKCPVCDKVKETTEETYEFKKVKLYWSEDGDFIKTKLKPIDRVMCQACSDHCKEFLAMKEAIDMMIKVNRSNKVYVDTAYKRYGLTYVDPIKVNTSEQAVIDCCGVEVEWRLITCGNQSVRIPFCSACGKPCN